MNRTTPEAHPRQPWTALRGALHRLVGRRPAIAWRSGLLLGLSALIVGAWLFLAVVHVDDRYRLDHVSGARMALARYVDSGTLYPELYDGRVYGGTRFMPLPIVLHGLTARITGEYVVSGKLLTFAVTVALIATVYMMLRRVGSATPIAVASSVVFLTTDTGLSAALNVRADGLPLLLQLLAVSIVLRSERSAATLSAAGSAALAFVCKLSAVWAPLAIVAWLTMRSRRRAGVFALAFVCFAGALVLAFAAMSDGRIFENVFGLSMAGVDGARSVVVAPYRLLQLLVEDATTAWALFPLTVVVASLEVRRRDLSLHVIALVAALGVLLIVLTDVGTGWNQLVDIVVLGAIVAGRLDAPAARGRGRGDGVPLVAPSIFLTVTLIVILATGFAVTLLPEVRRTAAGTESYRPDPLAGIATPSSAILSEDPYVPVSLDQTPVVLDPFMLLRLGEERPDVTDDLVSRIEAREFDVIVLVEPLRPVDREWWTEQHFGIDVVRAIERTYSYVGRVQGYHVYEPTP